MVTVVTVLVFIGAFLAAVAAIALSVAPQWRRIVRLAGGHVEQCFGPLPSPGYAERRVAVRYWATSTPAPTARMRAAA